MKCPKCSADNPKETPFCPQCGTPLDMAAIPTMTIQAHAAKLSRGSVFAGRYEIIEEIGKGGMGWVYKVYDKKIDEKLAIKVINPAIASDPMIINRFSHELKVVRKIIHKNVCRMYELADAEGRQYITMEFIEGEDLRSLISRVGQLTLRKTVAVGKQICDGLVEAHTLGIVHRDLKPQNIMIDKKGNVRIMDFGIAQSQYAPGITKTGMIIGTPEYMSPEQVEGLKVDQRSDIYSLGIILYEMLTGIVPFEGHTPLSLAMKHKTELPREPRDLNAYIPDALNRLILKCLEKDPDKRYATAQALSEDLAAIQRNLPSTEGVMPRRAAKAPRRETSITITKPRWLFPALGAAAVIAACLLLWFLVIKPGGGRTPSETEFRPSGRIKAGKALWDKGQLPEALAEYQAVLEKSPESYEAQISIARILRELGRIDESIPAFQKAVKLDPESADPYRELGELFQKKEDLRVARSYFRDYLKRAGDAPDAERVRRVLQELEAGGAGQQAVISQKAAEEKPGAREAGETLEPTAEKIQAEAAAQEDRAKTPSKTTPKTTPKATPRDTRAARAEQIRQGLAQARSAFDQGRFQESITLLRSVLKLEPDNQAAQNLLQQAEREMDSAALRGLVTEYVSALNQGKLMEFYQARCAAPLFDEIKSDAELITSLFSSFKSQASNQNIRIDEDGGAEVSFAQTIVGISKEDGSEQQLFRGTYTWQLEKRGAEWKIVSIRSDPSG